MKVKGVELRWFVLNHDFNTDQVVQYNALNKSIQEEIIKAVKSKMDYYDTSTYDKFKKVVDRILFSRYRSRCEYEILVRGLHSRDDNEFKIDIYSQLEPNLDIICSYIIKKLDLKELM